MARKKKAAVKGEPPAEKPNPETATPEATALAEKVADAAQKVADARKSLDEAHLAHQDAVGELQEASKGPVPEFGKHLLIEGMGRMDMPTDWQGSYLFRLQHNGAIYDHVSDDPATGVWVYRRA